MNRWKDVSYSIPNPRATPFRYCFEAPLDRRGMPMIREAMAWCEDQFGKPPERWGFASYDMVFIKNDIDACAFKMCWC